MSTQANVVNIAFGDYSGGILGQESELNVVKEGIAAIHAKVTILLALKIFWHYQALLWTDCQSQFLSKGGLVKIALGGALYSMGQYVTSVEDALNFAEQMQAGLSQKRIE